METNPLKVGAAEIHRVEEFRCKFPMSMLTEDRALVDQHRSWLQPRFLDADDQWENIFQSWILLMGGKVVLVDPCTGNGRSSPHFPLFDNLDTPYIERFRATGVRPEDVDYVFCTHLHGDHCGWNTELRGGRYVPTFPNARYIMVRREFDRWDTRRPDHVAVGANEGVFENSVLPVIEAGLAELVADRHVIMPGLEIEPAYGHTLGHSVLQFESHGEAGVFAGDCFHHPIEIACPEIEFGAEDVAATLASRRRLIAHCLERDALLIPAHFPDPYVGRLRKDGDQVVFVPLGS